MHSAPSHPVRSGSPKSAFPITRSRWPEAGSRGSVLIVAMLLAAVIAISLGSYLNLNLQSVKLATRTFYSNAAVNVSESGAEEALWCFNQVNSGVDPATAWAGWTISGDTAKRTFNDFTFSANTTGAVKVYVDNYDPSGNERPTIVSLATITLPNNGGTLEKQVEVVLRRRSLFATGLVAKRQMTFNGNNAYVDSWNSEKNDDGTPRASPIAYNSDHSVANDNGSIGSMLVVLEAGGEDPSISVWNADVYGTAGTAGDSIDDIDVGPNGRVGAWDAVAGYKDPDRVTTDFSANVDPVENTPTTFTATYSSLSGTVGTAGATNTYLVTNTINSNLTIDGDVTLVIGVTEGSSAINLAGNKVITITDGSSLTIYTPGNIDVKGNGIANGNLQPVKMQIYGTAPTSQTIDIGGGGTFKGVIYAPTAEVKIHGNGHVQGSVVGNNITLTGNAQFHYDESLADFGENTPFGITRWRELTTATERELYASEMSGW